MRGVAATLVLGLLLASAAAAAGDDVVLYDLDLLGMQPGWFAAHGVVENKGVEPITGHPVLEVTTMMGRARERHIHPPVVVAPGRTAAVRYLIRGTGMGKAWFALRRPDGSTIGRPALEHLFFPTFSTALLRIVSPDAVFRNEMGASYQGPDRRYASLAEAFAEHPSSKAGTSEEILLVDATALDGADATWADTLDVVSRGAHLVIVARGDGVGLDHPAVRRIFAAAPPVGPPVATVEMDRLARVRLFDGAVVLETAPAVALARAAEDLPAVLVAVGTERRAHLVLFDPPRSTDHLPPGHWRRAAWLRVLPEGAASPRHFEATHEGSLVWRLAPAPPYKAILAVLLLYVLLVPLAFLLLSRRGSETAGWLVLPAAAAAATLLVWGWARLGAGPARARSLEIDSVRADGVRFTRARLALYAGGGLDVGAVLPGEGAASVEAFEIPGGVSVEIAPAAPGADGDPRQRVSVRLSPRAGAVFESAGGGPGEPPAAGVAPEDLDEPHLVLHRTRWFRLGDRIEAGKALPEAGMDGAGEDGPRFQTPAAAGLGPLVASDVRAGPVGETAYLLVGLRRGAPRVEPPTGLPHEAVRVGVWEVGR